MHIPALVGSVWCSHYKCSLWQFVSEIKYHRTDKRCGVTNSLQFIVYVRKMTNRKWVCRVFNWEAVDALSVLTSISPKMYCAGETNV